jgi:hypothetical protein
VQPVDVVIVGTALNTQGFTAKGAIAGLGLNTFGFLWPCDGIWSNFEESVTTAWTNAVTAGSVEVCVD